MRLNVWLLMVLLLLIMTVTSARWSIVKLMTTNKLALNMVGTIVVVRVVRVVVVVGLLLLHLLLLLLLYLCGGRVVVLR